MNRSDIGDVEALVAVTEKTPNPLNQTLAPIDTRRWTIDAEQRDEQIEEKESSGKKRPKCSHR